MLRIQGDKVDDGTGAHKMLWEHREVWGSEEGVIMKGFPEELILALSFEGQGGVAHVKEGRKTVRWKEHTCHGQCDDLRGWPIIHSAQSLVDEEMGVREHRHGGK